MEKRNRCLLLGLFTCLVLSLEGQPVTPVCHKQESFASALCTKILLAPLSFIQFCLSSYTFLRRDKAARDLVSSRNEIDQYTLEIAALKKNKRDILRSKVKYHATFMSLDLYKVTASALTAIKKLPSSLLIIAKPFITVDAGPTYTLKAFAAPAHAYEQLEQDIIEVFFVPEPETLAYGKKIAVGAAPLGLAAIILLFLFL